MPFSDRSELGLPHPPTPSLPLLLLLWLMLPSSTGFIRTNRCYSCMSAGYEELFREGFLSKYFYEPKNFTSQCDHPMNPARIGFVPCRNICLNLVQDLVVMGRATGRKLTMRGCSTSLSRFGFVNRTMEMFDRYDMCREVKMSDLFTYETDSQLVTVCSCLGDKCNGAINSAARPDANVTFVGIVILLSLLLHKGPPTFRPLTHINRL